MSLIWKPEIGVAAVTFCCILWKDNFLSNFEYASTSATSFLSMKPEVIPRMLGVGLFCSKGMCACDPVWKI